MFLLEAEQEIAGVSAPERVDLLNAVAKLEALDAHLPFPHQSTVKGALALRELRPRSGRSPWRAFYRQLGDVFVIAAIGPEAQVNPRAFERTVRSAISRLDAIEE